ncbi:MAG: hypothetical protein PHF25_05880 [Candidatus Margulisbacteria bacterium]|nr:hypothetical protein [Candidatus Margulisiibacteriota bacterium]
MPRSIYLVCTNPRCGFEKKVNEYAPGEPAPPNVSNRPGSCPVCGHPLRPRM